MLWNNKTVALKRKDQHGESVISTVASEQDGPGFDSEHSVWSLYVLPMLAWVASRCSHLGSPTIKNMCIQLILLPVPLPGAEFGLLI